MLSDSLTQAERVLNTPLPEAYSIVISQITIIYVFALPFQLYPSLGWITIPATIGSSPPSSTFPFSLPPPPPSNLLSIILHHPRHRTNSARNRKPLRARRQRSSPGYILPRIGTRARFSHLYGSAQTERFHYASGEYGVVATEWKGCGPLGRARGGGY